MKELTNPKLHLADNFIKYTHKNIFLTGKAGTGKTTFLHNLRQNSPKRMIVTAPTGVAAINAKGSTLHSFFQLPFGPIVPGAERNNSRISKISTEKRNIIRSLELLVIDEISMVRADVLDAVDEMLRRMRGSREPFGGVQLLMIGDLQQLAPIARPDEWELLQNHYDSVYFFSSNALKKSGYISIELNHIYRQSDEKFIQVLNEVRDNKLTAQSVQILNERYVSNFEPKEEEGYITLCTHNHQAAKINTGKLSQLKTPTRKFSAEINGDFPEMMYPNDSLLELKVGAQVMFIKNDPDPSKRFFNGKIGKIIHIDEEEIEVLCAGEKTPIVVGPLQWQNIKYTLNSDNQEIEENIVGSFVQFPLKTAWAITIHKSQGLTFEKAIIDSASAFAHGQVYVALSRCKSLEGLVLSSPVASQAVICDEKVSSYNYYISNNQPTEEQLQIEKKNFQLQLLINLFDYQGVKFKINGIQVRVKEQLAQNEENLRPLQKAMDVIQEEIIPLTTKFHQKIQILFHPVADLSESEELQERIKSGSKYYLGLNQKILGFVNEFELDSDNKVLKKKVAELEERLQEELRTKTRCLEYCTGNFDLNTYLNVRAKAIIEKVNTTEKEVKKDSKMKHPKLYEILLQWRKDEAMIMGMEEHNILNIKVLKHICTHLPASTSELSEVPGLGSVTLKRVGNQLYDLIETYRQNNREQVIKKSGAKGATKDYSLELYKKGMTPQQIAEERGLAVSTIYGHLADCVKKGSLSISELLDEAQITEIKALFVAHQNKSITEIRALSGNKFEFWQLKALAPTND